jgi:hypothetical protein
MRAFGAARQLASTPAAPHPRPRGLLGPRILWATRPGLDPKFRLLSGASGAQSFGRLFGEAWQRLHVDGFVMLDSLCGKDQALVYAEPVVVGPLPEGTP